MRAVSLLFHDVYARQPAESGFVSQAANRYKLHVADFEAQIAGIRAVRHDHPALSSLVCEGVASIADPYLITVDDGGISYYTTIADSLERLGWRGHCFMSTDRIGDSGFLTRAQLRELDGRGHVIGSHSASHPTRFSALRYDEMLSEWSCSRRALEDILGHSVTVASLPGGYFSSDVAWAAAEAGIRVLFTSEPVTQIDRRGACLILGRFTVRQGHPHHMAQRFVSKTWARSAAWASWNTKALVKPLLGPSYTRIADWLLPERPFTRAS